MIFDFNFGKFPKLPRLTFWFVNMSFSLVFIFYNSQAVYRDRQERDNAYGVWSYDHAASRAGANDAHEKVDAVAHSPKFQTNRKDICCMTFFLSYRNSISHTLITFQLSHLIVQLLLLFLVKYESKPIELGSALKRQLFSEVSVL